MLLILSLLVRIVANSEWK